VFSHPYTPPDADIMFALIIAIAMAARA
jgi:hypothetical protein